MRRVKAGQEREDILQDVGIEWAHTLSHALSLSREEEDELSRSNKKVKDAQYESFNEDKASGYRDESSSLKLLLKMNLWGLYLGRTIKLLTS